MEEYGLLRVDLGSGPAAWEGEAVQGLVRMRHGRRRGEVEGGSSDGLRGG
jgi:hypothetical protein